MPTTPDSPQVLVVGGGPSGLVLAICLLMNDISVRIIEKSSLPRLGQRGAGIMPRSLELFAAIRIIEDVMKQAIPTPTARLYRMPDGVDVMHEFEMSPHLDATPTNPFLNPVMLGQDSLEKIFHNRLKELGCEVEFGTELESFEHYQTHVTAHLVKRGLSQDMATGERETANVAWMVGADGARGVMRKLLGLTFIGETHNIENFIVGDIRVEGLSQKYWHMWGGAGDVLVSLRATETPKLFNFLVGGKNVNHTTLSSDQASLIQFFRDHTGRCSNLQFIDIPWMSQYRPNIRMVDRFGYGRIFITGDAGHVHSPTGGQGMNTGIQDSFNLAWKLALVVKGISPPSLLDTFSEERIPVIAEMIAQTTRLLKHTLGNDERALKTDGMLYQLGVNYRWSSIVVDEQKRLEDREAGEDAYLRDFAYSDDQEDDPIVLDSYGADHDGRLRAGDRAPDASGLVIHSPVALATRAPTCQLFQIFGPGHHTMLLFSDIVVPKDILRALQTYPKALVRTVVVARGGKTSLDAAIVAAADFVLEDRDGHACNAYCPTDTMCGIVVVRPDGVVGAITRGLVWMHQYFSNIYNMK